MSTRNIFFDIYSAHNKLTSKIDQPQPDTRDIQSNIMPVEIRLLLTVILFIVCSNHVFANEIPNLAKPKTVVPEKIAGVETVNAEQLIEALSSDTPPILIDARIKEDRDHGYIESSISLPDIETNCESLNKLNKVKTRHMMFYCNGTRCGRSVVSIKVARSCGYQNLSWFKGGFSEWKSKGYQYVTTR